VHADLARALRGLEEATAFARSYQFELDAEYLRLISQVESLPENSPGADKSGGWLGSRADRDRLFRSARLLPRRS